MLHARRLAERDEGLFINGRLSPALKSGAPEQPNLLRHALAFHPRERSFRRADCLAGTYLLMPKEHQ